MGKIFSRCEGNKVSAYDVFLDFKNAKPTLQEETLYNEVKEAIKDYPKFLEEIEAFDGCESEIQRSIEKPGSPDLEEATWKALIPRIKCLHQQYLFSITVQEVLPRLLDQVCPSSKDKEDTIVESLDRNQSTTTLLAEILYFILKFDELKLSNASIQNVFPYYRRYHGKRKAADPNCYVPVQEDVADKMTLFFASPTPMLTAVLDTMTKYMEKGNEDSVENVTHCLLILANVCKEMVATPESCAKIESSGSIDFVLRVMVTVIIMYDHLHPVGAYSKKGNVDIRSFIKLLKNPSHLSTSEGLINCLRYRSKNVYSFDTPKNVKLMFES